MGRLCQRGCRLAFVSNTPKVTLVQITIGVALLVWGAEGFIDSIETVSKQLGISALVLSLLIAPLASEMPEKVNSILWVRRRAIRWPSATSRAPWSSKARCLPVLGIMMTPWQPELAIIGSVTATLIATIWLRLMLMGGQLRVWHMGLNGALYVGYLVMVLTLSGGA